MDFASGLGSNGKSNVLDSCVEGQAYVNGGMGAGSFACCGLGDWPTGHLTDRGKGSLLMTTLGTSRAGNGLNLLTEGKTMRTTEVTPLHLEHANVVELAALMEDKQLKMTERRILRQALRQTLSISDQVYGDLMPCGSRATKTELN